MTTISVRELKTNVSKILKDVDTKKQEFLITRHGKPCGKIVPASINKVSISKNAKGIRGSLSGYPQINEEEFAEAKKLWTRKK